MLVIFYSNITEATFIIKCRLSCPAVHFLCCLLKHKLGSQIYAQVLILHTSSSLKVMFARFPASSAFLSVVNNVSGAHVM